MQVTFIPSTDINSDLGVVNAARVSLGKKSTELCEADKKLIAYLAKHSHWTPFAHSRLYLKIDWDTPDQLYFYKNINQGGFAWTATDDTDYIKGSIYAWINSIPYLPPKLQEFVVLKLYEQYPISLQALLPDAPVEYFQYNVNAVDVAETFISRQAKWDSLYYRVLTATLLVKVPVFVARQIRTSQVGIAYSDLYVEGEAFVYNEVSRRYVNEEPEFYQIPVWRTREGKNVKQGSTGLYSKNESMLDLQQDMLEEANDLYISLLEESIAPEQARCLLPQSMYTEFYMTASLHRWAQWLSLRLEEHVQEETRYIASRVLDTLRKQYPDWNDKYSKDKWAWAYMGA